MANNMGGVDTVAIRSGDGKGPVGLDLAMGLNGPLLVSHVTVVGFGVGIRARGAINSQVLEHVTLKNQGLAGITNDGQVLSIRGVVSDNGVPAVVNSGTGVVTLIDCKLTGGAPGAAAVINEAGEGGLFARNIEVAGYGKAIENKGGHKQDAAGPKVGEFVSHPVHTLFPWTRKTSLNLPVKDAPEVPWEQDFGRWANVKSFGAKGDQKADDREAIQKAVDSGATTVYFPRGSYKIDGTVTLRGQVSRLVGLESSIYFVPDQKVPAIRLGEGADLPPAVVVDQLNFAPWFEATGIDNGSSRTLVITHCKGVGGKFTGTGELFFYDCGSGVRRPMAFLGGQSVWIRQLSNEPRDGATHLLNRGGRVWILGHKTEMPGTLIETTAAGRTELLGGFAYAGVGDCAGKSVYLVGDGAAMSATMGGVHFSKKTRYTQLVAETQAGETRILKVGDVPPRRGFVFLPLYVGRAK